MGSEKYCLFQIIVLICKKITGLGCVTRALLCALFMQPGPHIFLHFCAYAIKLQKCSAFPSPGLFFWKPQTVLTASPSFFLRLSVPRAHYSTPKQKLEPPPFHGKEEEQEEISNMFAARRVERLAPVQPPQRRFDC